jgi:hypothetical protein
MAPGAFGMNALARHCVGQADTGGQHSQPHFTILRLGALFFNQAQCVGPAVMSDDDARVHHGPRHGGKPGELPVDAFRLGMRNLGYVDGPNVVLEWRYAS